MDLETEVKPRLLNHEDPRVQLLTNLEDGLSANFIWKCIATYILISIVGLIHHDNIIKSHNHNEHPLNTLTDIITTS